MCGIYGISAALSCGLSVTRDGVERQTNLLAHRGPDGSGVWLSGEGHVGLGHRRLSIIDLSADGSQPLVSQCGRFIVVFNGEIYNYRELRKQLSELGRVFRTACDTEVVLAAYEVWGKACPEYLEGMFAFAVFERSEAGSSGMVFLARDRAGEKPLFFSLKNKCLEFASELKALTQLGRIDTRALNAYLSLGWFPGNETIGCDARRLGAGCAAIVDLEAGVLREWRYWSVPEPAPNLVASLEDAADEVWELLCGSVRRQLRADVRTGVFLSGGMDSSLVVAAAAKVSESVVPTFSVSFGEGRLDESAHARRIADYFGTDHRELNGEEVNSELFEGLAEYIDEPLGDSSILPMYLVSRETAGHVKVALGGDGGDEIFGGYRRYQRRLFWGRFDRYFPTWLCAGISRGARWLPAGWKGRALMSAMGGGVGPVAQLRTPYFDMHLRRRVLRKGLFQPLVMDFDRGKNGRCIGQEEQALVYNLLRSDFEGVLANDYLVKVDRASMANGLEVRSPYLDRRLVECAFGRIHSGLKVTSKERRRVQRAVAKRFLPDTFQTDRKQGFSMSVDRLMRERKMLDIVMELPNDVFRRRGVEALVDGHRRGRRNGARLFCLATLSVGLRNLKLGL